MRAARLVITAASERWATIAALSMTGFATSVIGCGCEAGLEGPAPERTPDGRPGVRVLAFARSSEILEDQLMRRVGQCVMTAATTACFDDLPSEETVRVGSLLRFFGDGHQVSKIVDAALLSAGGGGAHTPRAPRVFRLPAMVAGVGARGRSGVGP